jgi:radical SAM protein with 4Fe4S-binding SPASM domain
MSQTEVEYYLKEAASNMAQWVSFTGGEPFLFPDLLQNSIAYARSLNLHTEVVTNAFWANSARKAVSILNSLKARGLDVLNISVDDFHQEFIPMVNIRNAFTSARRTGVKTVFLVTLKNNSKITSEYLKEYFSDRKLQKIGGPKVGEPDALVLESNFIAIKNAVSIGDKPLQMQKSQSRCREVLTDIGIKPDGTVLPCCGALGSIEEAAIGNLKDESLKSILDKAWLNPKYINIRKKIFDKSIERCNECLTMFMQEGGTFVPSGNRRGR